LLAGRSRLRSQEASDWKKSTEQKLQRDPGSEAERNESVSDISNFQDPIPHLGEKTSFKMAQGGNFGGPRGGGGKSTRKIFIGGKYFKNHIPNIC